jgi:signal transduction histidine kinase
MPDRFFPARPSSQRLEMVEQELQDFSYTVSHDLAASFRRLSAFSHLFLGEFEQELTQRQRTYAKHVQAANDRCQTMMEQLLVFSRAQQRVLIPAPQDANLAIRMAMLQLLRDHQPIQATVVIEPLGQAYADPDLLGLVFRHLLSNADKFHPPREPRAVNISAIRDQRYWRLRIRDNGVGVPADYREQAFQMFRRLQADDEYPGVGAGLAICRRVAHRHNGEVSFLDSEEGACVELALPLGPRSKADELEVSSHAWQRGPANDGLGHGEGRRFRLVA